MTTTTFDGHKAVWTDRAGVMHLVEGDWIHPGIRLLWTLCGKKDIPANAAWQQRREDVVTCPDCEARAALAGER